MVAERYCLLPRPLPADVSGLTSDPLTGAERRVLAYVRAGYSNKEIAGRLNRAEATIKHQVSSSMRKFGLTSRMRLMAVLP
jgi:DNA-binding NarL/FixJ family response regulator